jgi:hypothetical protein
VKVSQLHDDQNRNQNIIIAMQPFECAHGNIELKNWLAEMFFGTKWNN